MKFAAVVDATVCVECSETGIVVYPNFEDNGRLTVIKGVELVNDINNDSWIPHDVAYAKYASSIS